MSSQPPCNPPFSFLPPPISSRTTPLRRTKQRTAYTNRIPAHTDSPKHTHSHVRALALIAKVRRFSMGEKAKRARAHTRSPAARSFRVTHPVPHSTVFVIANRALFSNLPYSHTQSQTHKHIHPTWSIYRSMTTTRPTRPFRCVRRRRRGEKRGEGRSRYDGESP